MESDFQILPETPQTIPHLLGKNTSLDSLLTQNEDLANRLRVTIRRLHILESDLQEKSNELDAAKSAANLAADQIFILKEKNRTTLDLSKEAEQTRLLLEDRLQVIEPELIRLRKYREKIQSQVKPYIQELRNQVSTSKSQADQLYALGINKDQQIKDLKNQILEITKNSKEQIRVLEARTLSSIENFERNVREFKEKESQYLDAIAHLENQASQLRMVRIQCDELLNENIALKRSKDDQSAAFLKELDRLTDLHRLQSEELTTLRLQSAEYESKIQQDYNQVGSLQKRTMELETQLDSLRFMWNSKNEENEKLKIALAALEKLNLELSQKLSQIRSESSG